MYDPRNAKESAYHVWSWSAGLIRQKPKDLDEYRKWLQTEHRVEVGRQAENYHDSVVLQMKRQIEESALWQALTSSMPSIADRYEIERGSKLLIARDSPQIVTKSFKSSLEKSFRKNVLRNDDWPSPPTDGWILLNKWYESMTDVVRTLIIAKFLDGVRYLASAISEGVEANGSQCAIAYEAREEGYYAAHLYIPFRCEIPALNWQTTTITARLEIQVTTQLQEVIRGLLHHHYEVARLSQRAGDLIWQWDYGREEFGANYLGHILHYLEAQIVAVRDQQKETTR